MKVIMKHLGVYFKKHWVRYVIIVCSAILNSYLLVVPAKILGQIVNAIVDQSLTQEQLLGYMGFFFLSLVGVYILDSALMYWIWFARFDYITTLRLGTMKQLLWKKAPFYTKFRVGDIVTRSSEDLETIGSLVGFGVYAFLNAFFITLSVLSNMVMNVWWELTLISVLPMPILAYALYRLTDKIEIVFGDAQKAISDMNAEVLEMIDGTYVIRAYGQEDRMSQIFKQKTEDSLQKNIAVAKFGMLFIPLAQVVVGICMLIGLIYGGGLVQEGKILLGSLVSFPIYIGLLVFPLYLIGDIVVMVQQGKVSFERIFELFETSDDLEEDGQEELGQFEEIRFENFSFTYPGEESPTLKNITVSIKKGQTIGIVGKTGSGKTTFLKQFLHQYPYHHETVLLNQKELIHWKRQSVDTLMAYVPQEHVLFSKSILENLKLANKEITEQVVWDVLEQAAIAEDIRRMPEQLDTMIGEKGITLSGGQKQRLSIARALLRNSEILLLDDALSAVDAKTENQIVDHLKSERLDQTNIITAHRLSAIRHADCILVFEEGQIVARGTHEELLEQKGWYYEQYLKQELEEGEVSEEC